MTPDPDREIKPNEVIATAEDLRRILDEHGLKDVPVFDVVLPELPKNLDKEKKK